MKNRLRNIATSTLLVTSIIILGGCCCGSSNKPHYAEKVGDVNVYISPRAGNIKSVTVLPFKAPTELIGGSVSDVFVAEIMRMNVYSLIERSQLSGVLNEAELSLSGISNNKAMQVGQMIGADGVIVGTVTEYEMVAYKGKKYPSVGITIRLIDCKTGKVQWSADYAERAHEKGISLAVYSRTVIHHISSALYKEGLKKRR
jgi:TolB-like protein